VSSSRVPRTDLDAGIAALKRDLLAEGGPQISTMRNHNFAILPYRPEREYRLRERIHQLSTELRARGWVVLSIALQRLLFDRLRSLGDGVIERLVAREKRLSLRSGGPDRGLAHIRDKLIPHIEGEHGLAADVGRVIGAFIKENDPDPDRTVVFIGRAGSLYPFFRTSALLKHIAGKTHNIPVVLLYPGVRLDRTALSFMGVVPADRDYRPRIYP
jgi:hypothetical protein